MYDSRKLNRNGDLPRLQGCGDSVCPSSAQLEKWNSFVAQSHVLIKALVKEEMTKTPWGELYGFVHPHNKTATDFIMSRGKEHAKVRLQQLVIDAYQILQKKMYYERDLKLLLPNSHLQQAYQKDVTEWTNRYNSVMDLLRGLRSRYSLTTPPSVPAPSVTTTEAGSVDTSDAAPIKIRVKRRLVPFLPEDQPEDTPCKDQKCIVDHTE